MNEEEEEEEEGGAEQENAHSAVLASCACRYE